MQGWCRIISGSAVMNRLKSLLRFGRRALLGVAVLLWGISLVKGWTFGTPVKPNVSIDYHAIASFNGTFYYIDRHLPDVDGPREKWALEFPRQNYFGWFSWETLGFQYISMLYPAALMAAATARNASGNVPGTYSVFVIAIPYWFIIALLSSPDFLILLRRLRARVVSDVSNPESLPAGVILEIDLPCVHCGYNLKMQPSNARCPECGAMIADTLTLNKELEQSRPGWLRLLSVGNALLAVVRVLLILMWPIAFAGNRRMVGILALIACGVYFCGVWLFTTPEHPHLRSVGATRARFQRFASIVILVLVAAGIWFQMNWRSIPVAATVRVPGYLAGWRPASLAAWVGAWLVFAMGTGFEYRFLAILAGRLLDRFMTEHCRIAGVGASVTSVLIIPVAPAIIRNRHIVGSDLIFMAVLIISIVWMLFIVWTGFMNLYCAARFLAQSWRAEKRWQDSPVAVAG